MMIDFILIVSFAAAGAFIGAVTGIIPGLHTNNIAILLLAILSAAGIGIYLCILIVAAAISHTFLDIIPSTFIGAPEEDTALLVLPAHSMVLQGRGYEAICISALASLASVAVCFALLLPFRFVMEEPINFYEIIEKNMPWILICISAIVIFTNENIWKAILIFLLAGIFGMVIIDLNTSFLIQSSPIFPALAGLFGAPALLYAEKKILPEQNLEAEEIRVKKRDIGGGVMAGGIVAILPGVSSAIASTLALALKRERSNEAIVAILSATNTATNFFVLASLFIILKARSGFAIVMREFINVEKWSGFLIPYPYNLLLIAVIVSSTISYFLTKHIGKFVAKNISRISYRRLIRISISIILIMVFLFTGFLGLLIFGVASLIGITCLEMKVRRSVCMGVLLLPLILNYFL